jgi:hypothetical protein
MPQRERIAGVLVGASAIHLLLRLGEGSVRHETAIGFRPRPSAYEPDTAYDPEADYRHG